MLAAWNASLASKDRERLVAATWLIWTSLWAIVIGAAVGILMGFVLSWNYGHDYASVLQRLHGKIWWAGWELLTFVSCLVAAGLLARLERQSLAVIIGQVFLLLLAATNLLYHFPSLFVVISHIATGDGSGAAIDAGEFRKLAFGGEVASKALHFWGASIAVSGVLLVRWTVSRSAAVISEATRGRIARSAARVALVAVLIQFPTGIWVVVQLPPVAQNAILGNDVIAMVTVAASLLVALGLLHWLASFSLETPKRQDVRRATAATVVIVTFMAATVHRLNQPGMGTQIAAQTPPAVGGNRTREGGLSLDLPPTFAPRSALNRHLRANDD